MEFWVLGSLEVRDGTVVAPLHRRRERALLAALLLRPGEVVSVDRLVEAIWGERPPRTATSSLQNAVSELRKALGSTVLVTRPPGYVLAVDPETIDAIQFERAVRDASRLGPVDRSETLARALALWRGPAFADFADEPFARADAARLEELRLGAIEDRIEADLELGSGADLVPEIEAHVAANPLRERLRGQLMWALYRSGRQADALETYRDARRTLVDSLGIEPSRALQELERRILRQDPTLLASARKATSPEPTPAPLARKTVTVVAATLDDISGVDPELLRGRVERFLAAASDAAAAHGGALDRFLGADAVAVFGVPTSHEDDALRAVRAAVELRERLAAEGEAIRVGVATGEALVGLGDAPVVGEVLTVATCLRDHATAGCILAAESTCALLGGSTIAGGVTDVGSRRIAARHVEAVTGVHWRSARLDTPFVGRERELEELREAVARATSVGRAVSVTIVGEPGVGKSRLLEELSRTLVHGRTLKVRIAEYGATAQTPVADLVRAAVGEADESAIAAALPDTDDGRLAARLLADLAASTAVVPRSDWFWAVRALLTDASRGEPLVVVIDDAHWADASLLDLVEYLVDRITAPALLVCAARPELLDDRPGWAASTIRLQPLSDGDARTLVAAVGRGLDERVRDRLVTRAEGNPLYLEQLVAHVVDEDGDESHENVPASIEAVLASRLDRLSPAPRATLQRAAVARQPVTRGVVAALSDADAPVDAALLELTRRGLLHPVPDEGRDDAYRFHHSLLRDVAYRSLPKAVRADLHERAADWLDRNGSGPDELVGWHLEQAHGYRVSLSPGDDALQALADRGGRRLLTAGLQAARASDPAARELLRRSAELSADARLRLAALLELGPWHRTAGDTSAARAAFASALELSEAVHDEVGRARALIELEWDATAVATERPIASLTALISELLPVLEHADDHRGQARAWHYVASAKIVAMQLAEVEDATRRAAHHAELSGWSLDQSANQLGTALAYGPRHVEEALVAIGALMGELGDGSPGWASVARNAAVLHAMRGNDAEADRLGVRSREVLEERGNRLMIDAAWTPSRLTTLQLRGAVEAARELLVQWRIELERRGNRSYLATALVLLAGVDVEDRPGQAIALALEAARLASPEDVVVRAAVASVRARACALLGSPAEARTLAAEARAALAASDGLYDRGRVELERARTYELLGDVESRDLALTEARALFAAKGITRAVQASGATSTPATQWEARLGPPTQG